MALVLPAQRLIQSVTLALACAAPMLALAQAPQAQQSAPPLREVELTLPQARDVARNALGAGQPALARNLAQGLLQADPRSGFAHYVLAVAEDQLARPKQARRAAVKAYRFAETQADHYEAAQLAARIYYKTQSPTLSQLWLRRAIEHAPGPRTQAQLERDYKSVRALNPLSFSIRGGLRPTNNVNSGAETGLQIIDGLPYVGTLSGSAQALSGLVAHADGTVGYRLRSSKRSRTEIGARLYVKRVALDDSAKALSPTSRNSDFGSTYGALTLRHAFAWGPRNEIMKLGASLGLFWSGGAHSYDFARFNAGQSWHLGKARRLSLDASFETRDAALGSRFDTQVFALRLAGQHRLGNGDAASLALNLQRTFGDLDNNQSEGVALSATYSLGQQIGPALVSGGVTVGHADYPDYTALFTVPGGRQDLSVSAHLDLLFPDMDYAGFAPSLRISTGRTTSNVSRFDTRELSVGLGIQSKF